MQGFCRRDLETGTLPGDLQDHCIDIPCALVPGAIHGILCTVNAQDDVFSNSRQGEQLTDVVEPCVRLVFLRVGCGGWFAISLTIQNYLLTPHILKLHPWCQSHFLTQAFRGLRLRLDTGPYRVWAPCMAQSTVQ